MPTAVVATGIPAATLNSAVNRNAVISDTVSFLARIRRLGTSHSSHDSLDVTVGKALRKEGIQPKLLRKTSEGLKLRATDLRSNFVDEILWFTRAGIAQLRLASDAFASGQITIGQSAAYYSSFYLAQALCRLSGRVPLHLREFQSNQSPGPTVFLAWDGLEPAHEYYLVGANTSTHRALWTIFFNAFQSSPDLEPALHPGTRPSGPVLEFESHQRNALTYLPWYGFNEHQSAYDLTSAQSDVALLVGSLPRIFGASPLSTISQLATDPELGIYARTFLRGIALQRFASRLAEHSAAFRAEWQTSTADLRGQMAVLPSPLTFAHALSDVLAA